ncbi:family 78 glycoside hydrolase catalytic domain [Sphingomonas sp. AP4-R1]|uniref:family 78 glycoside hydrolase catalytic domain n=1 Tax=Sphingomonas sp. AP4-R1 TaxID=2735134 RepID=UPI001493CB3B|nr:family 78 glycoside hydrolase catalytic domain [Sphingomonas sp. AP4-R1]QJU58305.1 family 78 glycoside hydrolase catalytic domain [Sphingomonas sp. AP4-R1]
MKGIYRMRHAPFCFALAFTGLAFSSVAQTGSDGDTIRPIQPSATAMPLNQLLDDPRAKEIVGRHAPKVLGTGGPQARSMTLADIRAFAPDNLPADAFDRITGELAALPPTPAAIAAARAATDAAAQARLDPAAPWITHPAAFSADFRQAPVALQFRRTISLTMKPSTMPIRVSADNRFILYVNGVRVAAGPARGDLAHWRYEIVDIAPYLRPGANTIAAQVWSDGKVAPVAQISTGHTGFMLKAERPEDSTIDTGPDWSVRVDASRQSSSGMRQLIGEVGPTYYAAGAPEQLVAGFQLDGWATGADRAQDWRSPVAAITEGARRRTLVPDVLPQMRYATVASGRVVRASGISAGAFPRGAVIVPAHSEAKLLIDAGRVLAAYPALIASGGRGATITLTYAEALYDPVKRGDRGGPVRFPDRAKVDDGLALGLTDTLIADGRPDRVFAPFWWRAWRYVEVRVKTGDQPLTLDRFETRETGYPFEQRGHFTSSDPQLNEIWRIGWLTGLFDAHETYQDSAYWEQLQYVGDTRIQALLSYDVGRDPKLAVQALDAFDGSRVVDGLPQSSWPISGSNPIPPFALLWIGMLHDYWLRQPDTAVLKRTLPGMRAVLDWYAPYVRDDGIVRASPGWLFVDWRDGQDGGRDRTGKAPDNCVISLLRLGALKEAADIENAVGDPARARSDAEQAGIAARGIQAQCWDAGRRLYADTPSKTGFSQHANTLAVLYDVAPKAEQKALLERVIVPGHGIDAPAGIMGTTFYFSFYLARALDHAGLSDRYLGLLDSWRDLLKQHFTTWPENPDPSRSDSHAWSAHPTSGLLTYVAGIQPAASGFSKVRISPHLGELRTLDAAMAHPAGLISTRYRQVGNGLEVEIDLPRGLTGTFVHAGREWPLKPGSNRIRSPAGKP